MNIKNMKVKIASSLYEKILWKSIRELKGFFYRRMEVYDFQMNYMSKLLLSRFILWIILRELYKTKLSYQSNQIDNVEITVSYKALIQYSQLRSVKNQWKITTKIRNKMALSQLRKKMLQGETST